MKTLMAAITLVLLAGCARVPVQYDSNGDPICGPADRSNYRRAQVIDSYWQRSFNTCQHDITKNFAAFKESGIAQNSVKREEYCSCIAGKVMEGILANECADIMNLYNRATTTCLP